MKKKKKTLTDEFISRYNIGLKCMHYISNDIYHWTITSSGYYYNLQNLKW